jgi:hypothetical protein
MRAPIFYDSGDTSYYLDPAGTSHLRHTRIFPSAITNDVWNNSIEIREVNGVTNTQTGSDYAPSIYFHWSNIAAAAIKMYSDGHIRIRAQSTTSTDYRNVYMASLFANIFYDNNNTAFYVDPASTSVLNNLVIGSISANGGVGTAGQVLHSNGSATYWATATATVNTAAQFTWTNTHTFNSNTTFGNSTFANTTVTSFSGYSNPQALTSGVLQTNASLNTLIVGPYTVSSGNTIVVTTGSRLVII